ncbi:hypothetical protein L0F63_006433 [Massospora cicadina]|nr:hypothetical protein L0F63_006433 [Massospora cicadina]
MDKPNLPAIGAEINLHVNPSLLMETRVEEKCPATALSCVDDEDGCCIPDMGKMTLALQWVLNNPMQNFTLHGFWPGDCATGVGPERGCRMGITKTKKDVDANPELKRKMEAYWVSHNGNNQLFWDHEWNKHGTCLSTVREECPLGKEEGPPHIRYFKAALREYEKFNVYEELELNGITPRMEPYKKDVLVTALKRWGASFSLQCIKGRLNQIFFYRLGKARNQFVDRIFSGTHACPFKIYYYPKLTDPNKFTSTTPRYEL